MHLQRMSSRPEVPGMSSKEKSGVVVARFPTTMKLRMGERMGGGVDPPFVREAFTGSNQQFEAFRSNADISV